MTPSGCLPSSASRIASPIVICVNITDRSRSAGTTIASSSTPSGRSSNSPTGPSGGPPRPAAPTTPNPPATPSRVRTRGGSSRQQLQVPDQLGHLVPRPDQADREHGQVVGVSLGQLPEVVVVHAGGLRRGGH